MVADYDLHSVNIYVQNNNNNKEWWQKNLYICYLVDVYDFH